MLFCENQPYYLVFRPGETGGAWIKTSLENSDPWPNWYGSKSQQQSSTGFTFALLNKNKGDAGRGKGVTPKIMDTINCPQEERLVPKSRFCRLHQFPYHVPVVVCRTHTDSRAFSCAFIQK